MSDEKVPESNLENIVLIVCIFLLVVLCAGSPDLLDAIIHKLMSK